jgi:hypothetical protein
MHCSVRLYLQLFVGGHMSYVRYVCLFGSSLSPVVCRQLEVKTNRTMHWARRVSEINLIKDWKAKWFKRFWEHEKQKTQTIVGYDRLSNNIANNVPGGISKILFTSYIYYWNLQVLNEVINIKSKILLPQTQSIVADYGLGLLFFVLPKSEVNRTRVLLQTTGGK